MKQAKKTKIIFMGTPEFALPVLDAIAENFDLIAVVTKPDTPKRRRNVLTPSPVKERAVQLGVPVLCPEKVKTPEFLAELSRFEADFIVTCAYGKILPQSVLDLPKQGCVNVHASLLPKYRGSAPIWRVVMDGETKTGVTTMLMDAGMDTGDMLLRKEIEIGENETMSEVHDKLAAIGAELLVETIEGLLEGRITPEKQDESEVSYAPPLTAEDEIIDFTLPAAKVHNKVRACDDNPGAYGLLETGEKVKIWKTSVMKPEEIPESDEAPGSIVSLGKKGVAVICGEGAVLIKELQISGAKRMDIKSFLNGHKLEGKFKTE